MKYEVVEISELKMSQTQAWECNMFFIPELCDDEKILETCVFKFHVDAPSSEFHMLRITHVSKILSLQSSGIKIMKNYFLFSEIR